jgi:protein-tyrosine phosphatase
MERVGGILVVASAGGKARSGTLLCQLIYRLVVRPDEARHTYD